MTPSISRRLFLQLLAATAAPKAHALPGTYSPEFFRPESLLDLPRSASFGLTASGASLIPGSFYRESTEHASELSFDVSNNQISASITRHGEIRRACICCGVEPLPAEKIKGGVYCTKQLLYGGPWFMQPTIDAVDLQGAGVEVALIENLLPLFSQAAAALSIHTLIFAPVDLRNPIRSPRALLQITLLQNHGSVAHTLNLYRAEITHASMETVANSQPHDSSPGHEGEATSENPGRAIARCVQFDPDGKIRRLEDRSAITLHVAPHATSALTTAWILSETQRAESETISTLGSRSVSGWLEDTLEVRRTAYGKLSIPQASFAAESVVRFSELSRQSALRTADGKFSGGFLGSDVDTTQVNWTRDTYYSMLAMSLFEPALCADSIPYFLEWGQPSQTTGSGRSRFPGATSVSQSLSNSVSGLSIAGAYYRATGDRNFFISRPEILQQARRIFDEVLASRRSSPMLFPSMYFSDGEARGDFHTGSNVAAWYAFTGMAHIASEAYRDDRLAQEWATIARNIHDAIDLHCAGDGPAGRRFFEGANADGTFIPGHDGEESETTLMPFYGFCNSDDPRLLSHATLAMTTQNPFYSPDLDAIWWYNSDWRSATFPGWTTALAGTEDELQLQSRLDRIRSLTDLDGSLWWWPYPYGSKDRSVPMRADSARKCGWGAAVYLCRFINDILGISTDARSRSIRFAPFIPWNTFSWEGASIGSAKFDIAFDNNVKEISATIVNRNPHRYSAIVILTPRKGMSLKNPQIFGASPKEQAYIELWRRPALQVTLDIAPGQRVRITAKVS